MNKSQMEITKIEKKIFKVLDDLKTQQRDLEIKQKNQKLIYVGELLSQLSHNIRNPLQVIGATLDVFEARNEDRFSLEDSEDIIRIKRTVKRISEQIENVLDFVRETAVEAKPTSLIGCIQNVLRGIIIPESIKIELPEKDYKINVDQSKMEIVFSNLIQNAIEAIGHKEGQIKIEIHQNEGHILIDIIDSGPGIQTENIKDIFEPLFTTKHSGTGLGLASCNAIIKLHRGKITVKNNPTTFSLKMPSQTNESDYDTNNPEKQKTILETLNSLGFERITNSDEEVFEFVHKIKNKEHCIFLFENHLTRDSIVNEFLSPKISQKTITACFAHDMSKYECDKKITYDQLLEEQKFIPNKMSRFLIDVLDESYENGIPRIACEDTAWFSRKGIFEEHQEAGSNLDKKIIDNSTILCCYNMEDLNREEIQVVIKSRNYIILEKPFSLYVKS